MEDMTQNTFENDDIEELTGDVSIDDVAIDPNMEMDEDQQLAYRIIRRTASLKGVTIDRTVFLRTELAKKYSADIVEDAISTSPQKAGVALDDIDALADAAISIETRKVAGLSALAGIPGGLAMVGTIPADIAQYFAHALRIEQKLAYLYGWESFLNDEDEVDDETMYRLILFLGVMMQVGGVNVSLTNFAAQTAKAGVAKAIEKQALTKTFWYGPLKKVLRVVGVNVTKKSFAEVAAKGVPVLGGLVSGGLTYATFHPGAVSLKKYLRTLPQATGVILPDDEMAALIEQIEEESKSEFAETLKETLGAANERVGAVAAVAGERASIVADAAKERAGVAAKAAAGGIKRGIGGLSAKLGQRRGAARRGNGEIEAAAEELRALKGLLDEGIITQDEFDAKKRELLGL